MGLDNVLDDRQSQSTSLDVVNQAGTDPMEAVEDLLLLIPRDADPLVLDRDRDPVTLAAHCYPDLFARGLVGVFDRVVEQIAERLGDRAGIDPERRQRSG